MWLMEAIVQLLTTARLLSQALAKARARQLGKERLLQCLLNYEENTTRRQQMSLFALRTIQQQVAAIAIQSKLVNVALRECTFALNPDANNLTPYNNTSEETRRCQEI